MNLVSNPSPTSKESNATITPQRIARLVSLLMIAGVAAGGTRWWFSFGFHIATKYFSFFS
jgi:hypothetical protein